jgi:hypothetical protein
MEFLLAKGWRPKGWVMDHHHHHHHHWLNSPWWALAFCPFVSVEGGFLPILDL